MADEVSGVLDPSAKPKASWKIDLLFLAVILGMALTGRVWYLTHTEVASRDAIVFVRFALHLESPPVDPKDPKRNLSGASEVIRRAEHPPGYPIAILAMSKIVRNIVGETSVYSMILSAQLVSVLSALLLILPLYSMGKILFDRKTAFIATLLVMMLPDYVEISSDGISDSLFLLTAVTALWFGTMGFVRNNSWYFIGAGVAAGLGYITRPEGTVVALAIGITIVGSKIFGNRPWRFGLLSSLALIVGFLTIGGPYVATIGRLTNKPSGAGLIQSMTGTEPEPTFYVRPANETSQQIKFVNLPWAVWLHDDYAKGKSRIPLATQAVISQLLRAIFWGAAPFALLGIWVLRERIRQEAALAMLLVLGILHLGVVWYLAYKIAYVSQRHTLILVVIGCLFAAASLPTAGKWFGSLTAWGRRKGPEVVGNLIAGILIASCLPGDFKTMHYNRAGHKEAGIWLAQHAKNNESIVDPFGWTEFYAGRTFYNAAPGDPCRGPVVFSIVEPNNPSPHSRLPQVPLAQKLSEQGTLVFRWPTDGPWEKVKVAVYQGPPLTMAERETILKKTIPIGNERAGK